MTFVPAPAVRIRTKSTGPRRTLVSKLEWEATQNLEDDAAARLAGQRPFPVGEAIAFILGSSYVKHAAECNTSMQGDGKSQPHHYLFGACNCHETWGLTERCKLCPGMRALLVALARKYNSKACFTSLSLSVNASTFLLPSKPYMLDHDVQLTWIPLQMPTTGGRLWSEIKPGDVVSGQPTIVEVEGRAISGQVHNSSNQVTFSASRVCGTEQWDKEQLRVGILLASPQRADSLPSQICDQL